MHRRHGPRLALAADAELAAMAVQGDRAAFGELVRRSAPAVNSLLRRMGAQAATADDVTQDAMIAALNGIAGYGGRGPFVNWTMTIAARLYLKRHRKEARIVLVAEPVLHADPVRSTVESAERMDLDHALAKLSAAERMCVSLCHGAGMTHEEIASSLGIPLGTAKSHVLRGLKKLRVSMTDLEEGAP